MLMTKTGSIFLAVIVFFLSCFIAFAFLVAAPNPNGAWFLIGFVVSLGLGIGTYLLIPMLQKRSVDMYQATAQTLLEAILPPGERLLASLQGYTGPGRTGAAFFGYLGDAVINAPRRKWYYLGLTPKYVAIVQVKGKMPTGVSQVLPHGDVKDIEYETAAFREPKLVLEFVSDRMELRTMNSAMNKQAKELAQLWHETHEPHAPAESAMLDSSPLDTDTQAREHLTKAIGFQRMGMLGSAEHESNQARQINPLIVAEPSYKSYIARITEEQSHTNAWRLPFRVGAFILLVDVLVSASLGLLTLTSGSFDADTFGIVVHMGVDLYLSINLFRLKEGARRTTLWWAVVVLILGAVAAVPSRDWIDLVMTIFFSGSLVLLLVQRPSKVRSILAIALFVIGYLCTLCGTLLFAMRPVG